MAYPYPETKAEAHNEAQRIVRGKAIQDLHGVAEALEFDEFDWTDRGFDCMVTVDLLNLHRELCDKMIWYLERAR